MALAMEVGFGPGDCVRWGPSYPQNRGHTHDHPVFGPCLLWPNGWMDEGATWYGSRPRPSPHCIRRGPTSARNRHRAPSPHLFGPCLLWPRSPTPATAELLLHSSRQKIPILYNGPPFPQNCPFPWYPVFCLPVCL